MEAENIEFADFGLRDNVAQLFVFEVCMYNSIHFLSKVVLVNCLFSKSKFWTNNVYKPIERHIDGIVLLGSSGLHHILLN